MRIVLSTLMISWMALYSQAQLVQHGGTARSVMTGQDLSAHVKLDTLLERPHLFGVGPYDNLQGEITILDGQPIVSTVIDGQIHTTIDPQARAPFLAYSHQKDWTPYPVRVSLRDLSDLQQLIDSLGRQHGYTSDEAFPFKITGQIDSVHFHIIMRDTNEIRHSHDAHKKAKVKFTTTESYGELIGFFSRQHEGIFTHKNQYIHVHYVSSDRSQSGHLDDLYTQGLITVYLPGFKAPDPILVNDTDFSKGRLGFKQMIYLDDLVKLHGHLCDGLVIGYLGMKAALYALYPDSIVDRTNTRVVTKSSPCLADAALILTGGRYQYNTYEVNNDMPFLFILQRIDNGATIGVQLKPGIKPAVIDTMGEQAIQNKLSPCDIDHLRQLEDDFSVFLLNADLKDLFTVESISDFEWSPFLLNNFLKTDILNKDAPRCRE